MRLVRNPDLLVSWRGGTLFFKNLDGGGEFAAGLPILVLLDFFGRPRTSWEAKRVLRGFRASDVLLAIQRMEKQGFLLSEKEALRRRVRLKAWKGNVASALYHVACRDLKYIGDSAALLLLIRRKLAGSSLPAPFKRYRLAPRLALSAARPDSGGSLEEALAARRTCRRFSRHGVSFEDLSSILRRTWGQTGWLDGGPLGRLVAKTSPSAGSLHPIECYVLAWNVTGLVKGLYHYDVKGDELRRLRSGDHRRNAVKAASGQRWVGNAAFLCIMTAVFERTLWKYDFEAAYRVLWMDAGHLAQTFALLATSHGLGPFQTAAIQDSYIEDLLGLDGVKEFPVYLCGAGVPRGSAGTARAISSRRRGRASVRS